MGGGTRLALPETQHLYALPVPLQFPVGETRLRRLYVLLTRSPVRTDAIKPSGQVAINPLEPGTLLQLPALQGGEGIEATLLVEVQ